MPLRSAPPPPSTSTQSSMRHHHGTSQPRSQSNSPLPNNSSALDHEPSRKAPPPRPPPPRLAPISKSSSNVFGNLFGKSKMSNGFNNTPKATNHHSSSQLFSLPPPPAGANKWGHHQQHHTATPPKHGGEPHQVQLISFDSPPSSPKISRSTKPINQISGAANYDIDLLSSDPTPFAFGTSSSSAQLGFEDAFVPGGAAWDSSDPFSPLPTSMPTFEPRPANRMTTSGAASFQTPRAIPADFLDPLCNGKSLLPPQPVISMPTIIKPGKPTPNARPLAKLPSSMSSGFGSGTDMTMSSSSSVSSTLSASSYPMAVSQHEESYAIVLFEFQALQDGDLSLRANEKVYLLRQINDDWYFGRKKSGQEGVFPASYVDVKVALRTTDDQQPSPPSVAAPTAAAGATRKVRAAFDFTAQTNEDLTLRENDIVTVLYAVNDEWWYGELGQRRGQFPAAFVETI